MPKRGGKENKDPDFVTGKSRKAGYYDRKTDDRNISKQLEKLKGKWVKCLKWKELLNRWLPLKINVKQSSATIIVGGKGLFWM